MDSLNWAALHGAATHFPIVLVFCSGACDAVGHSRIARAWSRGLRVAGYGSLLIAALSSIPAVFSGIVMTRGAVLGHGALRWHHLFAWPAFGLIMGLAVWRVCIGPEVTRGALGVYLVIIGCTAGLVAAAGYWGGEMMLAS